MKTTKLTIEEHATLGAELKIARNILIKRSVQIGNTYGGTSKAHRRSDRALRAIDNFRCEMDNQIFRDYPAEATTRFYYGGEQ